jgi:hypothetical protein
MTNATHALHPFALRTGVDIWRLWNMTSSLTSKNLSLPGVNSSGDRLFFDTYFSEPRFSVETLFALLAAICNVCALVIVHRTNAVKRTYSAYNTMFINLAIANIIASLLSWLTNNIIYLFEHEIVKLLVGGTSVCSVFLTLLAAVYVSCSFEVVSVLNILGATIVQYYAICRPLYHLILIRQSSIHAFIAVSWSIALLLALMPFHILAIVAARHECDTWLLQYIIRSTVLGANISICVVAAMYAAIFFLCIRIYAEIRRLRSRLPRVCFASQVNKERKAFVTTLILLVSLTVFFFPYTVMFMTTLNMEGSEFIHKSAVIYYLNLLPYLKFITDPIIYGMRMREVQLILSSRLLCLKDPIGCFNSCDPEEAIEPPGSPTATINMHQMSSFEL